MWIGLTHWLFRIAKEDFDAMLKKMDELFYRVFSVLIAFMALRGPVNDSASKEFVKAVGFTDEFFPSAYIAVAHILLTFLGAFTGAYTNDFRFFDEAAIVSGFLMCIMLVLELFSYDTVHLLVVFAFEFIIGLVFVIIVALDFYKCWNSVSRWVISSCTYMGRTVPPLWHEVSAFWARHWKKIVVAFVVLTILTTALSVVYFILVGCCPRLKILDFIFGIF